LLLTSPGREQEKTYMAGAINIDENGPMDVPSRNYYYTFGTPGGVPHPLDVGLNPPFESRSWPFVLERYVTYRGNEVNDLGRISNIFDWETHSASLTEDLYFGIRISFIPSAFDTNSVDFGSLEGNLKAGFDFSEKAFSEKYKYLIPLVSAELPIVFGANEPYKAAMYEDYVQQLICELIKKTEYKMLFTHVFPLARYMSYLAVYIANSFVPSMAQVSDGWAATVFGKRGGGQWIGFGKNGGMRTWRGNEGMKNSFQKSKRMARQMFEASCNTNYLYKDREQLSSSEVLIDMTRTKNDSSIGIKWWQWSSLRPAPCKKED
jgi:hypothetical protein